MVKDLTKGILLMILCTFFTSMAVIFNKKGAIDFAWTIKGTIFNWALIVGLSLLGIGFIILSLALKYGEVSLLYPIISLSFIWAYLFSILIYNEAFQMKKIIAISIMIFGIVVLLSSKTNQEKDNSKKEFQKVRREKK